MLVCNVSLRPPRTAIAAAIAEAGTAIDTLGTGNVVFATLVDDPASVGDILDAYLGEIMLEAASAGDTADAYFPAIYAVAVNEAANAIETQSGSTAITDPSFASVKLLMGFEGANGSTVLTDESPAAHGNASIAGGAISTAQAKFGSSSFAPNPAAGGALYSDSADWRLSSANSDQFTIDVAVRFNTVAASKIILSQYTADGTFSWTLQTTGSSALVFQFSPNGTFASSTIITGPIPSINTWYQVAVDKDATGKLRLYVDGAMVASTTPANSAFFDSSVNLGIGTTGAGAGILDGYIDELRITKGVARYASDSGYAVATAAFPRA